MVSAQRLDQPEPSDDQLRHCGASRHGSGLFRDTVSRSAAHRSVLAAIAAITVASPQSRLTAQVNFDVEPMFSPQPATGAQFGRATCVVDVDRDGFADIIALESGAYVDGQIAAGRGWVFYGPTLASFATFAVRKPSFTEHLGGGGCCTGDVNGDGWPDLLVGSPDYIDDEKPDAGRAHVFLGPDFKTDIALHDPVPEAGARMGDHGLLLFDADSDGLDDVFVGCIRHDQRLPDGTVVENSGRVYYWPASSITSGSPTAPIAIENPLPIEDATFGWFIAPDQVSGGKRLLVSKPHSVQGGEVLVLDTSTFDLVDSIVPPSVQFPVGGVLDFGTSLATGLLGPGNQPGLLVTAIGSFLQGPGCTLGAGSSSGAAFLFTGQAFESLAFTFVSPDACNGEKQHFGIRSLVLDFNRDGEEDLVITDASKRDNALVRIFYGPDYSTVDTLGTGLGPLLTTGFGNYLAAGDIDADGFDELVVYASMGAGSGALYIHDWRTLTCDVDVLSIATGGDAHFAVDLSPAQAGKTYLAALGISGSDPGIVLGKGSYVRLNVDAVTWAGLALLGTPLFDDFTGTLDAAGQAVFALHFPAGFPAALAGSTLTVAAVVIGADGRPGAGSSAVHIELAP